MGGCDTYKGEDTCLLLGIVICSVFDDHGRNSDNIETERQI